jgi:hypothetical protein
VPFKRNWPAKWFWRSGDADTSAASVSISHLIAQRMFEALGQFDSLYVCPDLIADQGLEIVAAPHVDHNGHSNRLRRDFFFGHHESPLFGFGKSDKKMVAKFPWPGNGLAAYHNTASPFYASPKSNFKTYDSIG